MEFAEAVELAKSLEEKAIEYEAPEAAEITRRRVEFSPQEYSDMSYAEALALYARVEKVIAGAEMLQRMYGEAPEAPRPEPEVPTEIIPRREAEPPKPEERLAAPAPLPPEKEPGIEAEEAGAPPPKAREIEIEMEEKRPGEEALEFEKPEVRTEIGARPVEGPKPPEEGPAVKRGAAPEVSLRIPPVLSTSPLESAIEDVEKLERQFKSEVKAGGKLDREDAKKRMLELTRELFKEKSVDRREEIKKEIVGLKAMLTEAEGRAKPRADIFTVVKKDQEYEVSSAKKAISDAYEGALAPLLKYYDEEAALGRGSEALPVLEERAAKLREQVANLVSGYEGFLVSKHLAELDELGKRGRGTHEMSMRKMELAANYGAEFAALKNSIWAEIDSALAKRSRGEAEGASDEELLAYLQAEEPMDYQRYARGEMTRVQALAEARKKLAAKKKE